MVAKYDLVLSPEFVDWLVIATDRMSGSELSEILRQAALTTSESSRAPDPRLLGELVGRMRAGLEERRAVRQRSARYPWPSVSLVQSSFVELAGDSADPAG